MKKRLLLLTLLVVAIVSLFAISASATETTVENSNFDGGVLYKSTTNEFGTVNCVADGVSINSDSYLDNSARVVLKNADGTYSTYPTRYLMKGSDWQGPYWDYATLSALTDENYEVASVIRVEIPEGAAGLRSSSFKNSTELVYVKIASTVTALRSNCFESCEKLAIVEFAYDYEKYPEFGSALTELTNGAVFSGCTSLVKLVFPNSLKTTHNSAFVNCSSLKELNLGASYESCGQVCGAPANLEKLVLSTTFVPGSTRFSYNAVTKASFGTNLVIYYTGNYEQAVEVQSNETNAYEIKYGTLISYADFTAPTFVRDETLHYFVYGYNYCDAFYDGNHATGDVKTCTEDVTCQRTKCALVMESNFTEHKLVKTLAYANGFDNVGEYVCYCENASYCTVANVTEEKSAIIAFKGYSTPETGSVKGINAGFKIDKELLTLYNNLNEVDATLTIFMVNSKSNDVNISKILDGDTLELADGVKGINVKITSVNYTSISVEVRGFDDSEGGNFYTLNLITAIAVKTADGVHYVQAGLKNSPNTTQTVDGVDFNIVTANKVYNPAS
ncbi:MAG: leucine-rich repeat protein [Clostridia bacterium]|nr:leucine-rich repeat protein [Clostridia bacterium]